MLLIDCGSTLIDRRQFRHSAPEAAVVRFSRVCLTIAIVMSAPLFSACFHRRARDGGVLWQAMLPLGLDSTRAEDWIARQRARCKDRFVVETDYRVFAVECVSGSSSAK